MTEKRQMLPDLRVETERMQALASDADVLAACHRFQAWLEKESSFSGLGDSALAQKILFLRNALENKTALREALRPRTEGQIDDLLTWSRRTPERVETAAQYVVNCLRQNPQLVDYDPKFLFMAEFLENAHSIYKTQPTLHVTASYNALLAGVAGDKIYFAYELYKRTPRLASGYLDGVSEHASQMALIPTAELLYQRSFGLGGSINNRDGLHAWDEGRIIASGLADYITAPRSRGQLCSMVPPGGETQVNWDLNTWVTDPRFASWYIWTHPKELLDDFDMMNAEPSIALQGHRLS